MMTIDEAHKILEEIAEELPYEFYKHLNGGILLLPDVKKSQDGLYVLGEYTTCSSMGRYITIYYGSFECVFGNDATAEKMARELKSTLLHEFTHHFECLAGDDSLEKEDERKLAEYRRKKNHIRR